MDGSTPPPNDINQTPLEEYDETEVLPGVYLTDYRHTKQNAPESPLIPSSSDLYELPEPGTLEQGKEVNVMPGVYMTDFREEGAKTHTHLQTSYGATVHRQSYNQPELAAARIKELTNSIAHLERSNVELEAMKVEEPNEPIWAESIEENIRVIARQKAEIAKILEEIPVTGVQIPK